MGKFEEQLSNMETKGDHKNDHTNELPSDFPVEQPGVENVIPDIDRDDSNRTGVIGSIENVGKFITESEKQKRDKNKKTTLH